MLKLIIPIILLTIFSFLPGTNASAESENVAEYKIGQVGTLISPDLVNFDNGEVVFGIGQAPAGPMKAIKVVVKFFEKGGFDNAPYNNIELKGTDTNHSYFIGGTSLAAKPIKASYVNCGVDHQNNSKKNACPAKMGSHDYQLIFERGDPVVYGKDETPGFGGRMVIRNGNYSKTFSFKYPFDLIWMGDANGDGKIDIITSELDKWGKATLILHVSEDPERRAGDELKLEERATHFEISGC